MFIKLPRVSHLENKWQSKSCRGMYRRSRVSSWFCNLGLGNKLRQYRSRKLWVGRKGKSHPIMIQICFSILCLPYLGRWKLHLIMVILKDLLINLILHHCISDSLNEHGSSFISIDHAHKFLFGNSREPCLAENNFQKPRINPL